MHLWLRLTILGIFAAAGLSLAIAAALPTSSLAVTLSPASSGESSPADASPANIANPPPRHATEAPAAIAVTVREATPVVIHEKEEKAVDPQALLDEAFQRWNATHWPPVAKQFDQLEQSLKARIDQASAALEEAQKVRAVPQPEKPPSQELPPVISPKLNPPAPNPEAIRDAGRSPEIEFDTKRDVVSVTALGSDVREVLKALSDAAGLNILVTPNVIGAISLSLTDVEVEHALNAILKSSGFGSRREGNFLFVGTQEELQKMSMANDHVGMRVYRPNYVTAADLQKLVTSMLTPGIGLISISTAPDVGIISNKDQAGGNSFAGSDVLVVRDLETILQRIDELYQEIDQMPAQVIIEATILSVRLDDQDSLGVDFELLRNKENIRIVSGQPLNDLATLNFDDGLKIGFLDQSLFMLVQALETIGDTHVVATPRVMCLNKQRAEILIGSELGYISTTVTETAATQSVEFLEVGTHLKLRPFISQDGMVRLEVHPELSTGSVRVQGGFTLPDKDVTQVTTNVMCRSGATVVIGGLIREDLVTSAQQIPVLGNLPLVGALFRQRTEDTERREIIVLLTPRILDETEMLASGEKSATEMRDRRDAFFDKMQPINKRRIGDRYGRMALSSWTVGNVDSALRYANLAIHYDPLHQDAINLRQQIITAYPQLEPNLNWHQHRGLSPLGHPLHDYSAAAGWPWRDVGPAVQPPPPAVYESGEPGPIRHFVTDAPPRAARAKGNTRQR